MKAIPYWITLEQPLLAPTLSGDPNSATSYPFIPGSLIRGALVAQYNHNKTGPDLAKSDETRNLFFNAATRFLNAYPAIPLDNTTQVRSLPIPESWVRKKLSPTPFTIYDQSSSDYRPLEQPKSLSKPFCYLQADEVRLTEPTRHFNVHTRRENREMGRATEGDNLSAVFRYEALAAGQQFGGVLLYDGPDEKILKSGQILLGGSRSTGYGLVSIEMRDAIEQWREIGGTTQGISDIPANTAFTLTLLSDLVIQDKYGQFTTNITEKRLLDWFGVTGITILKAFKANDVAGGFNRKWGLPLIQTPVVKAGTVFVLQSPDVIPAATIVNLENTGVGKRRVDGFGRLGFNWHGQQSKLSVFEADDQTQPPSPVTLTKPASQTMARTMHRRLLVSKVDGLIAGYVHKDRLLRPNGISPSQPGRLRTLLRAELSNVSETTLSGVGNNPAPLIKWLDELKPTGRKQFEEARVGNESLIGWLRKRFTKPETVWDILGIDPQTEPLGNITAPQAETITTDLKLETEITLRLVDGVLARLAKEAKVNG